MKSFQINARIEVPVNLMALINKIYNRIIVSDLAYNTSGMVLVWNFVSVLGVHSQTQIFPSESGNYEWVNKGNGMYGIIIPASGGATVNNDIYGFGWITGTCDDALAWCGPILKFKP